MRLFFALQPAAATALAIADWRDRQLVCDGKAVAPANFHITLAFLGELPATVLPPLCAAIDNYLAEQPLASASLELDTLGYWPRPGILWLGPKTWPPSLQQLALKLRGAAQRHGGKRDRNSFQPHITLFRRVGHPPAAPASPPAFIWEYRGFSLCESRRGKTGVGYHNVCDWQF